MRKTLNRIGRSIPLTATFSTFASVIPANIAYHGANALNAPHNAANSLAEFTAVASAAVVAGLLVRGASKDASTDTTDPSKPSEPSEPSEPS